jgi:hypothetical protein
MQCSQKHLIIDTLVIWKMTAILISNLSHIAPHEVIKMRYKTYNISVNLNCHGGYPLSCTVGLNKINKSGSLLT